MPPAGWHSRLLPVAVIGAVTAVVTVAALLAVRPVSQAQPHYYVTISEYVSHAEAVVHKSANGKVTGQLSPDGIMLAASLRYQVPLSVDPLHYGGIDVINLVTGATRTWISRGLSHWPGPPSWVDGDRMVAFT